MEKSEGPSIRHRDVVNVQMPEKTAQEMSGSEQEPSKQAISSRELNAQGMADQDPNVQMPEKIVQEMNGSEQEPSDGAKDTSDGQSLVVRSDNYKELEMETG